MKPVRIWLWIGVFMVLIQVLLGGITRLTGSGLSITEWDVLTGSVPPLNTTQWQERFDMYKQYPQYKLINEDMTLGEFKTIFFWEYLHRNWARLIGIVFLIPFIYFLIKKKLSKPWIKKLLIVFVLGGLQGLVGWLMVSTGLENKPWVSAYSLTLHLLLALLVYMYLLWLIFSMDTKQVSINHPVAHASIKWVLGVVILQIIFGGFMAGSHAGMQYNTYPLMNGRLIPSGMFTSGNFLRNIFENTTTINFIHRTLAAIVVIGIFIFWYQNKNYASALLIKYIYAMVIMVVIQFLLGLLTLLSSGPTGVPILLGVAHQMGACMLLGIVLATLYYSKARNTIVS